MRQAVLTAKGFDLRDVEVPSPGPGQVLVRSKGLGICEGDVFRYRQFMDSRPGPKDEAWMGHEGSGVVVKVGKGMKSVAKGDVVTALGGPYAEQFVIAEDNLVKVPEGLDVRLSLGEPVACCVHAAGRFGIRLGDRVALVGAGFMGQMCLQLARLEGAAQLCSFDLMPWRLPVARELGADVVVDPSGKEPKEVLAEVGEFDVVIEAAGTQSSVDLATALVRQHGRIVLVGYHQTGGGMRGVNMQQWNFKAIEVVNGHVRNSWEKAQAMAAGVRLIAAGRLRVEPLVSFYEFGNIGAAFRDLVARKEGLFKALLVP
jgi:threonine dehydrogenase-like Zn-dependent dehydrogenase